MSSAEAGSGMARGAVASDETPGPPQELGGRRRGLVGQLLLIRQAAVVVDRDVDPAPADVPGPVMPLARDTVTAALPDPPIILGGA